MKFQLPYKPNEILCPIDMSELSDLALKYAYVGAHHKQFEQDTVVGRTTELVLRHASVPVLAVPYFNEGQRFRELSAKPDR